MRRADFWKKLDADGVQCLLCSHRCRITAGKTGLCGVRENRDGILWSLVYGRVIAQHVDPIEKKPLFHFFPGTRSYSIATVGCNFRCRFCQNADISQAPRIHKQVPGRVVPAEMIVADAESSQCASIAYTYTEPTVFMEFARDVAQLARRSGIRNIFVSNGFMSEEGFDGIKNWLDAANIDLKSFRDDFYKGQCGARLKPVVQTLERMKRHGIWLEVTTLIIPGLNDDPGELRELAAFIASLGPETPWHVSRFHPTYQMTDRPPTPVETLQRARQIGMDAGLHYVYTGNIPGDDGENTYCHQCGALLIKRYGFTMRMTGCRHGTCAHCATPVAGVGL